MLARMARPPRQDLAGIPQHVVQRGNNRLPCFLDDEDRQRYLQYRKKVSGTISDEGTWTFGYNALGEVLEQTDARNLTTSTQYDKLGRPSQVSATVDIDGVAPLDAVVDTFTYDLLSRPVSVAYDNATATPGTFLSEKRCQGQFLTLGRLKG